MVPGCWFLIAYEQKHDPFATFHRTAPAVDLGFAVVFRDVRYRIVFLSVYPEFSDIAAVVGLGRRENAL